MFMQQFSAICIILFFANDIFAATGTSMSPEDCTIIVGVIQVAVLLAATLLIDRLERKVLLLLSSAVTSLSLVLPRTVLPLQEGPRRRVSRVLRLAAIGRALCVLFRFLDGVGSPAVGDPGRNAASSCQGLCHGNLHSLLFFVWFCGRQGVP
uniref:Putative integral to membrane n=1 Tax=Ixodes ricinus TaxID=34613 RepID=V5HAL8_IXORI